MLAGKKKCKKKSHNFLASKQFMNGTANTIALFLFIFNLFQPPLVPCCYTFASEKSEKKNSRRRKYTHIHRERLIWKICYVVAIQMTKKTKTKQNDTQKRDAVKLKGD